MGRVCNEQQQLMVLLCVVIDAPHTSGLLKIRTPRKYCRIYHFARANKFALTVWWRLLLPPTMRVSSITGSARGSFAQRWQIKPNYPNARSRYIVRIDQMCILHPHSNERYAHVTYKDCGEIGKVIAMWSQEKTIFWLTKSFVYQEAIKIQKNNNSITEDNIWWRFLRLCFCIWCRGLLSMYAVNYFFEIFLEIVVFFL